MPLSPIRKQQSRFIPLRFLDMIRLANHLNLLIEEFAKVDTSKTEMSQDFGQEFSHDFKASEYEFGTEQTFNRGHSRIGAEDEKKFVLSDGQRIECLKQMEIYRKLLLDQNPFI